MKFSHDEARLETKAEQAKGVCGQARKKERQKDNKLREREREREKERKKGHQERKKDRKKKSLGLFP